MDWKKNFGPENRTQKNIDRQATTHKWWTEGKNLGSENRTKKKKHRRATTHKWWTETRILCPKIGH